MTMQGWFCDAFHVLFTSRCFIYVCCCEGVVVTLCVRYVCHSFVDLFDDARVGAKEKDNDGRLPLHWACFKLAPVEVVIALLAAHPDGEATCLHADGCRMGVLFFPRCLVLYCVGG